jgi:hypothetical protein
MKCYQAKFTLPDGGGSFSEIWAETKAEAEEIAASRGMGPTALCSTPRKEFRPSVLATLPGGWMRADVLHSLCYLSFLAARHGVVTAEELVRDGSPLHEFAHMLGAGPNIRGGKMEKVLKESCEHLERIIPGMPPADAKLLLPRDDGMAITVKALSRS